MIHKKKTAAIAAVTLYIQSEQEQRQVMAQAQEAPAVEFSHDQPISAVPSAINLWGIGGRGQQMQMRNLMQMKSFHRSKP